VLVQERFEFSFGKKMASTLAVKTVIIHRSKQVDTKRNQTKCLLALLCPKEGDSVDKESVEYATFRVKDEGCFGNLDGRFSSIMSP